MHLQGQRWKTFFDPDKGTTQISGQGVDPQPFRRLRVKKRYALDDPPFSFENALQRKAWRGLEERARREAAHFGRAAHTTIKGFRRQVRGMMPMLRKHLVELRDLLEEVSRACQLAEEMLQKEYDDLVLEVLEERALIEYTDYGPSPPTGDHDSPLRIEELKERALHETLLEPGFEISSDPPYHSVSQLAASLPEGWTVEVKDPEDSTHSTRLTWQDVVVSYVPSEEKLYSLLEKRGIHVVAHDQYALRHRVSRFPLSLTWREALDRVRSEADDNYVIAARLEATVKMVQERLTIINDGLRKTSPCDSQSPQRDDTEAQKSIKDLTYHDLCKLSDGSKVTLTAISDYLGRDPSLDDLPKRLKLVKLARETFMEAHKGTDKQFCPPTSWDALRTDFKRKVALWPEDSSELVHVAEIWASGGD
jgi:hypothetical protein